MVDSKCSTEMAGEAAVADNILRYVIIKRWSSHHYPLIYSLRFNNIEKSKVDTRNYRGLQLENGLKAILVSDPKTDMSSAALSVEIG